MTIHDLPLVNACLNGLATFLLLLALLFIKQQKIAAHRATMLGAFVVSCVFLVFYVAHKVAVKGVHTTLGAEGVVKTAYYLMLASHIILAIAIVPMALVTLARGLKRDDARHRRLARITWPLWFYVSVTGVLVYLMLYQWFPSQETLRRRAGAHSALPTAPAS